MAKAIVSVGLEFKRYLQEFPPELQKSLDKWKSQLSALNDQIIARIRERLGDGKTILPEQYLSELAAPATEGWKAFVGVPGNTDPSAVIGALKHELRVKGGVFKYIDNTENAFAVDPATNKSYFQERVESAYESGMIKKIFAALQVVGARWLQKTMIPALINAMGGDRRYAYLLEHDMVSGYAVAGYKVISANNQMSDFTALLPAFEPHHAIFLRAYLQGAVVERFHLAVAADNLRETDQIDDTGLQNYLKQINTPFSGLANFKEQNKNDVAIAFVDPLDPALKPVDTWTDRRDKAAIAFCVADGTDTCSELAAYLP